MRISPKAPSAIDQRLGAQLRARRLGLGISQTEVANRLGVTFQQVQKYENGMNRIPSGRMPVIAEMLGIRVADLYEGLEEPSASSPSALGLNAFLADKSAVRIIAAWPHLPSAVRAALAKLAQSYAEGAAEDAPEERPAKRRAGER